MSERVASTNMDEIIQFYQSVSLRRSLCKGKQPWHCPSKTCDAAVWIVSEDSRFKSQASLRYAPFALESRVVLQTPLARLTTRTKRPRIANFDIHDDGKA